MPAQRDGRATPATPRALVTLALGAAGFAWALWSIRDRLGSTLLLSFGLVMAITGGVAAAASRRRRATAWFVATAAMAALGAGLAGAGAVGIVRG